VIIIQKYLSLLVPSDTWHASSFSMRVRERDLYPHNSKPVPQLRPPSSLDKPSLKHLQDLKRLTSNEPIALRNRHLPSSIPILQSKPFLANSTFLASSPAAKPPLLAQIIDPSPNSTLSSCSGNGHGQCCGMATQESVPGHRYLEHVAVNTR
jgi:hypothetical protein